MSMHAKQMTARQIVLGYARMHSLRAHGSDRGKLVIVVDNDKRGHEAEVWRLAMCESWEEARTLLCAIEDAYLFNRVRRPWEVAREAYTGKMKPVAGERAS